jgi:hypothetical protein
MAVAARNLRERLLDLRLVRIAFGAAIMRPEISMDGTVAAPVPLIRVW